MSKFYIYRQDDDGNWYRHGDDPKSFTSQKAAVTYAKKQIGSYWNVRPAGERYAKSQLQHPAVPTVAQVRAQQKKSADGMRRQGYVSGGNIPGGGEFRWTVVFSSDADAKEFAAAVLKLGEDVRSVSTTQNKVQFASGPNHWPGALFANLLTKFGGKHSYVRS